MMSDQDRIKLAGAMGWRRCDDPDEPWGYPPGGADCSEQMPDPFSDANDDYRVLEWMRKKSHRRQLDFAHVLSCTMNSDERPVGTYSLTYTTYQVGDYARAALKVIE